MSIRAFYDQWPQYNQRLIDVIGTLTDDQLAITPGNGGPLPEQGELLPTEEELEERCSALFGSCSVTQPNTQTGSTSGIAGRVRRVRSDTEGAEICPDCGGATEIARNGRHAGQPYCFHCSRVVTQPAKGNP